MQQHTHTAASLLLFTTLCALHTTSAEVKVTTNILSNHTDLQLDAALLNQQVAAAYAAVGLPNDLAYIQSTSLLQANYPIGNTDPPPEKKDDNNAGTNAVLAVVIIVAVLFLLYWLCWYNNTYQWLGAWWYGTYPRAEESKASCVQVKITQKPPQNRQQQYGSFQGDPSAPPQQNTPQQYRSFQGDPSAPPQQNTPQQYYVQPECYVPQTTPQPTPQYYVQPDNTPPQPQYYQQPPQQQPQYYQQPVQYATWTP